MISRLTNKFVLTLVTISILSALPAFKANGSEPAAKEDKWQIRFAQIFSELMRQSEIKPANHLYFMPETLNLNIHEKDSYNQIELNKRFAGDFPPISKLDEKVAHRLDATFVIVPGFGHHLIERKCFQDEIDDIEKLGFGVIYAGYEDSFENDENCAKQVYDIIKKVKPINNNIIFLTHSKGSPVALALLDQYKDIADKTIAMVSFAGAIRGSGLTDTSFGENGLRLLKAYARIKNNNYIIRSMVNRLAGFMSWLDIPNCKEWNSLLKKTENFKDDLADLPEGVTGLTPEQSESNYKTLTLPDHIKLFSISAVYPESEYGRGAIDIKNPDDLFLYALGKDLYNANVFHDSHILQPHSEFFPANGESHRLAILKTDHWGITYTRVLSKKEKHNDPFPRKEMLNAVILVLDEYFSE